MNSEQNEKGTIYIGQRDLMSYVLATVTVLNQGFNRVTIKARGRAISRAVDVAEITRKRFSNDIQVQDIQIGTETLETKDGKQMNVSTIEIVLLREE